MAAGEDRHEQLLGRRRKSLIEAQQHLEACDQDLRDAQRVVAGSLPREPDPDDVGKVAAAGFVGASFFVFFGVFGATGGDLSGPWNRWGGLLFGLFLGGVPLLMSLSEALRLGLIGDLVRNEPSMFEAEASLAGLEDAKEEAQLALTTARDELKQLHAVIAAGAEGGELALLEAEGGELALAEEDHSGTLALAGGSRTEAIERS
jgi:hypothetical protein